MRKYIVLNENGYPQFPIYFEGDEIPTNAIEMSDEDERHYLSNQYKDGDEWKDIPVPEPTEEEKLASAKASAEATIREQLAESDYKCLKFVDGDLTATEYKATKAERKALREKFNLIDAATTVEEVESILAGD